MPHRSGLVDRADSVSRPTACTLSGLLILIAVLGEQNGGEKVTPAIWCRPISHERSDGCDKIVIQCTFLIVTENCSMPLQKLRRTVNTAPCQTPRTSSYLWRGQTQWRRRSVTSSSGCATHNFQAHSLAPPRSWTRHRTTRLRPMILVLRSEDVNTCVDLASWRMNRCDDAPIAGSFEVVEA